MNSEQDEKKIDVYDDPNIQANDDGTFTVLLDYPVKAGKGEGEVSEVTMRRPTVADMEASDNSKGDVGKVIMMIASTSELPVTVIRRMDGADFTKVSAVFNHLSGGGEKKPQATGGK